MKADAPNTRTCGGCGRVPSHYSHPCPNDARVILCGSCRSSGYQWAVTGHLLKGVGNVVEVKR